MKSLTPVLVILILALLIVLLWGIANSFIKATPAAPKTTATASNPASTSSQNDSAPEFRGPVGPPHAAGPATPPPGQ